MNKTTLKSALFIGFFAALIATQTASAQDGSRKEQKMEQRVKTMTDSMQVRLGLNDDQYKKVYAINTDFTAKAKDIKSSDADKKQKVKQARALMADRDNSLKSVLTGEQFTQFKAMEADRKAEMKVRRQEKNSSSN